MKEQVSVAYVGNTAFLDKNEYVRLKQSEDKLNQLYSICKFNEKTLEDLLAYAEKLENENTRLKRLDENVKKELKNLRAQSREKYVQIVEVKISWLEQLLESLDK